MLWSGVEIISPPPGVGGLEMSGHYTSPHRGWGAAARGSAARRSGGERGAHVGGAPTVDDGRVWCPDGWTVMTLRRGPSRRRRRPAAGPRRVGGFEADTELLPRLTNTGQKRVVGRPRIDWAQALNETFCSFAQCSRSRLIEIVSDKQLYHFIVERLCRHTALNC